MKKAIGFLLFFLLCFQSLFAQWSILQNDSSKQEPWYLLQRFTPEEWNSSNFASQKDLQWFRDAKYGMFIHFGLSTYIGKDLGWELCYTRKAPDFGHGPIPDSVWTKYPEKFSLEKFDAKAWVDFAKKAGFKYIVAIAKHLDGFHLWNTKYSDFNIMHTPFGRDYLKELADACHAADMKFGIYYCQRDFYQPDYAPVDTSMIEQISDPPYYRAKPGIEKVLPGPTHQKYIEYQFNVVRELCSNYGKIDIFWFDACWWGGMFTADMWQSEQLTRMIRQLQPGIIIDNRASIPGDFDTPEQRIGSYQSPRPWESCVTLCQSWSWSPTPIKPLKTLVKMLCSTADGNGNMLLSWGPKWEGAFDPDQIKRLEEMGEWLKKYGQTIYNTKGGPWYPADWGGSTYRDNKAFLHISSSTKTKLLLPLIENKILSAICLTGGKVIFEQNKNGISLDLSKCTLDPNAIIIEFVFQNKITAMVKVKSQLSKFSGAMYGSMIADKGNKEIKGNPVVIDLGKIFSVTGVDVRKEKKETDPTICYKVEVSVNGRDWVVSETNRKPFLQWEATVAQFSAGVLLPGVDARYVKISKEEGTDINSPLQLEHVHVYGK